MATTEPTASAPSWPLVAASLTEDPYSVGAVRQTGSHDEVVRRLLALGDVGTAAIALTLALGLGGETNIGPRLLWGLLVLPLAIVLFKVYGLYDGHVKRMTHSPIDDLPRLLHATMTGTLLLWLYSKVSPLHPLDVLEVTLFAGLLVVLVTSVRAAVLSFAPTLLGPEIALVVGDGEMTRVVAKKLDAHPGQRLQLAGLLTGNDSEGLSWDGLDVLGTVAELPAVAAEVGASRVVVSSADLDEHELEHLLRRCRALSLKVTLIPQLSAVLGPAVEVDDVGGVTVLGVNPPWLPRSSRAFKRTMDVALAATLLVVLAPLLVVMAIAIKLDSPGPVFFTQERIGKAGRRFRLFKFRTMVHEAEQLRAQLLSLSTDPNWLKLDRDPRVTRVGRVIRRLSLDEMPQLWNVLRGEMSMVGPRPLIESEDERVEGWNRARLDLTPGITGYWQVLGRTSIPFEEMVKLDYLYVMNWSLWEDLRLMLRTLPAVLSGRGAN